MTNQIKYDMCIPRACLHNTSFMLAHYLRANFIMQLAVYIWHGVRGYRKSVVVTSTAGAVRYTVRAMISMMNVILHVHVFYQ